MKSENCKCLTIYKCLTPIFGHAVTVLSQRNVADNIVITSLVCRCCNHVLSLEYNPSILNGLRNTAIASMPLFVARDASVRRCSKVSHQCLARSPQYSIVSGSRANSTSKAVPRVVVVMTIVCARTTQRIPWSLICMQRFNLRESLPEF